MEARRITAVTLRPHEARRLAERDDVLILREELEYKPNPEASGWLIDRERAEAAKGGA